MKAINHTRIQSMHILHICMLLIISFQVNAFIIVEDFESSTWVDDQGWYDMRTPNVTTEQFVSGTRSLAYTFNPGDQQDTGFGGMRLTLPESDTIYLSYNRMFQDGWVWGPRHDLHDFYVFADADRFQTPTDTKLTAYFESSQGMANTIIRAAQQTNSPFNDNWYHETGTEVVFNAGQWHNVEAMVKMNDPGQSNGEMRMWVDGELQVERVGLLLRAAGDEDIMFNQLFFGPWMISGSAITQTFWTDDIMISDQPFENTVATPIPGALFLFATALTGLITVGRKS